MEALPVNDVLKYADKYLNNRKKNYEARKRWVEEHKEEFLAYRRKYYHEVEKPKREAAKIRAAS